MPNRLASRWYALRLRQSVLDRSMDDSRFSVLRPQERGKLRVSAVARSITPVLSMRQYIETIQPWVERASALGCHIIAFPEHNYLDLIGLLPGATTRPRSALEAAAPALFDTGCDLFARLARQYGIAIYAGTFPEPTRVEGHYATGLYFDMKGSLQASQHKLTLSRWETDMGFVPGQNFASAELNGVTLCFPAGEDAYSFEFFRIAQHRHCSLAVVPRADVRGDRNLHVLAGAWVRAQEASLFCLCPGLFGDVCGQSFRSTAALYSPLELAENGLYAGPSVPDTPTLLYGDIDRDELGALEQRAWRDDENLAFAAHVAQLYALAEDARHAQSV